MWVTFEKSSDAATSMRITSFRIENFKNIRLAECSKLPDLLVICGGNGCGKSAVLSAVITAKEAAGSYGGTDLSDRSFISAGAETCKISMDLSFDTTDQTFLKVVPPGWSHQPYSDASARIELVMHRDHRIAPDVACPEAVRHLLRSYSQSPDAPGFFDYIDAHRAYPPMQLEMWQPNSMSDEAAKATLVRRRLEHPHAGSKFHSTKLYLAGLKIRDLQSLQKSMEAGNPVMHDSLAKLRSVFNEFLAPLRFVGVDISSSPFRFVIATPGGEIDIDDLSSGEKEILNIFVRFDQLKPKRSIILFDEADAHLHPDLQRRYLKALRRLAEGNQLWLTTHSPEMMMAAGSEFLFTIFKQSDGVPSNQFVRVTRNDQMHLILSELMGTHGLVSFNQRVIFIEGDESSADRAIYESFYPPGIHNVSFVPVGNSATVRKTAERVNHLLTESVGYQHFYSIVDGDIERAEPDLTGGSRLFRLPVYHVENFLLDETAIYKASKQMLGVKCPYKSPDEVSTALIKALLSEKHLKPFTKALLDTRIATRAKHAYDACYKGQSNEIYRPIYNEVQQEAEQLLKESATNGQWKAKCKGRDLLKAYCADLHLSYENFRNLLISQLGQPPEELAVIMKQVFLEI